MHMQCCFLWVWSGLVCKKNIKIVSCMFFLEQVSLSWKHSSYWWRWTGAVLWCILTEYNGWTQQGPEEASCLFLSKSECAVCPTRQHPKIGKWKSVVFFFCPRHTLSRSFDIFGVTYRVINFLPKLVHMLLFLWKKTEFYFFNPYFPVLPSYSDDDGVYSQTITRPLKQTLSL